MADKDGRQIVLKRIKMYYFTQIDPDFKLKGSRDPLGFQSVWSHAGHKLIAHLSTVSTNIVDFQILCYAQFWYKSRSKDDNRFVPFFIKIEQAFAYARKIYLNQTGFNGITVISKRVTDNKIVISENQKFLLANDDTQNILSNQRAYGIYGKYIRPFRDMKLLEYPDFDKIIENSVSEKTASNAITKIVDEIFHQEKYNISASNLKFFANLIERITKSEQKLFTERILKTESQNHIQDLFFEYVQKQERNYLKDFNLYSFTRKLRADPFLEDNVKPVLEEIENTERIISICNHAYNKLLSKAGWKLTELKKENDFWANIKPYGDAENYVYSNKVLRELREVLKRDTEGKVNGLIARNQVVKSLNGNHRGWTELKDNKVIVLYGQTDNFMPVNDYPDYFENSYFIDSYLNLYSQILDKKWKN